MFHIVHYHADGGQACIPGRQVFTDPAEADKFAEFKRKEPGHTCGPGSVTVTRSEYDPGSTLR